jgi:signal transduction histidine kinase
VRIVDGGEVWMSAERALYHIEQSWISEKRPLSRPIVVSVAAMPQNRELLTAAGTRLRLPYAENSLTFRFYSGTDSWRRTPGFEYRLGDNESWTPIDGSVLSFRALHEGKYQLAVRVGADRGGGDAITTFAFEIMPPWSRSWAAYGLMAGGLVLVLLATVQCTILLARKRHRMLERLVQERTRQLAATMERLTEETQNAATLAERNRLANEIHDSVQQGLTGAILQLDTTLKLPTLAGEMHRRLGVVRNMISYARQEVQHAVWDMESPLLEGTDLPDALRNLTAFIESGDAEIEVTVSGEPVALARDVNHHLLRIAQEATTNAFRHAHAQRISIRLDYEPDLVALVVADNGVGFRPDDVLHKGTGHLGLRGIRTRVKKIAGELTIESMPEAGTTIRVVVPLTGALKETDDAAANRR